MRGLSVHQLMSKHNGMPTKPHLTSTQIWDELLMASPYTMRISRIRANGKRGSFHKICISHLLSLLSLCKKEHYVAIGICERDGRDFLELTQAIVKVA